MERFSCLHVICIVFNQATLRILEQIKQNYTRIDRKRFLFNDSHLCFIFSQYYNYCWILTEGLKNYQITCTVLHVWPAATIVCWKINALPVGNLPEITVLEQLLSVTPSKHLQFLFLIPVRLWFRLHFCFRKPCFSSALAQWLGCWICNLEVPSSNPQSPPCHQMDLCFVVPD